MQKEERQFWEGTIRLVVSKLLLKVCITRIAKIRALHHKGSVPLFGFYEVCILRGFMFYT